MTVQEINKEIVAIFQENEEIIQEGTFILNQKIGKNVARIQELQQICPHHFIDGVCEFCYKKEQV